MGPAVDAEKRKEKKYSTSRRPWSRKPETRARGILQPKADQGKTDLRVLVTSGSVRARPWWMRRTAALLSNIDKCKLDCQYRENVFHGFLHGSDFFAVKCMQQSFQPLPQFYMVSADVCGRRISLVRVALILCSVIILHYIVSPVSCTKHLQGGN